MAERSLVFSNPQVYKLLKEDFIPVAADDWYQRRRNEGGALCLHAGGTLLGYNNNRGADRRLKMMRESLKKWEQLPREARSAAVGERGKIDEHDVRALPDDVQVIKVYPRVL